MPRGGGIYFESKSEPLAGQLAVGEVIANRADLHGRFPSTYCGVLFQRSQFTFVHGHLLPGVPRASRQWKTAVAIASIVDQDLKDLAAPSAVLPCPRRVAGLEAEARRRDRQSYLLSLARAFVRNGGDLWERD